MISFTQHCYSETYPRRCASITNFTLLQSCNDSMDTPPLVYPFNMHGNLDCFQPRRVTKWEVDVCKSPGAACLCQWEQFFKKLTDISFVVFWLCKPTSCVWDFQLPQPHKEKVGCWFWRTRSGVTLVLIHVALRSQGMKHPLICIFSTHTWLHAVSVLKLQFHPPLLIKMGSCVFQNCFETSIYI